ncbi:hypothetical protein JTE90_000562 [Oedothorax gibbosus]|uniref:BTB domain-containing protein n=1 Tax=Oedothorax gibbosus TaxID=931172 RepID=A0AAV6VVE6_9ARAC|nr:hypothetical protein JTE90_000562 [Oedothorax gibbosus]
MNSDIKNEKSDEKPDSGSPGGIGTSGSVAGGIDVKHESENPAACCEDPDGKSNEIFVSEFSRCVAISDAESGGKDVRSGSEDIGACCEDGHEKSDAKPASGFPESGGNYVRPASEDTGTCWEVLDEKSASGCHGTTATRGSEDSGKDVRPDSEDTVACCEDGGKKVDEKPVNRCPGGTVTSGSEASGKNVKPTYIDTETYCEHLDDKSKEKPAIVRPRGTSVAEFSSKDVRHVTDSTGACCEDTNVKNDIKPYSVSPEGILTSRAEASFKDLRTASIFFYRSLGTCSENEENTGQIIDEPEEILKIFDLYRYSNGGHLGDAEGLSKDDVKIWLKTAGLIDRINGCSEDFDKAYDKAVNGMKSLHFRGFKQLIENLCQQKKIEPQEFFKKLVAVGLPQKHEDALNNFSEQV